MATNEAVISSALTELKDFDVLQVVKPVRSFVPAAHLQQHYFRFYIHSLERHVSKPMEALGKRSAAVGSSGLDTVCVECTMRYFGEPIGPTIASSQSRTARYLIEEWVEFPIKYCELPLDVEVVCEVKSSFGIVGSVMFHPFTSRGELKTGPRRYPLAGCQQSDCSSGRDDVPTSLNVAPLPPSGGNAGKPSFPLLQQKERRHYDVWELVARERAHGRIVEVPWLDKLVDVKLAALREAMVSSATNVATTTSTISATASTAAASAVLSVEFPVPSNSLPIFFTSIPRDHDADALAYDIVPGPCVPFYDLDRRMENLSEAKASVLSRSLFLISDADAQPGFRERKWISAIIHRPLIQLDPPKVDDEAVLWKFRRFLTKDQKAFLPFMSCVDWDNRGERTEAERLMPLWKTISVGDALVCLSYLFRDTVSVRRFAVDRLSREPVATVLSFALQLVQAVRYDVQSELATFLTTVALQEWDICCHIYWFMSVEVAVETSPSGGSASAADSSQHSSTGKIFTKAREAFLSTIEERNPTFHRQILDQVALRQALTTLHATVHRDKGDRNKKIEVAKELLRTQACGLRDAFLEGSDDAVAAASRPPMTAAAALSNPAQALTAVVQATQSTLTSVTSPLLQLQRKPKLVTLPTHPNRFLSAVTDEGFYMFKSAKVPMKLYFVCPRGKQPSTTMQPHSGSVAGKHSSADKVRSDDESFDIDGAEQSSDRAAASNTLPGTGGSPVVASPSSGSGPTLFPIIFKSGDDVRQDQLVIQIIELMDRMLKDNGLNLCLTPYRVLATSPNDGFVEVVPDVETFQSVQKDVIKYLSANNKTPEKMAAAMERFVKSCAGYSVITFILGIGDRHLENLLITTDGRLLHIDFGFIFGNDPKPFPPPMKICKEMVDAMGGPQSQQYGHFKTYCCSAYNILRKHSAIIMATLLLMVDASIPQISGGQPSPAGW